MKIQVTGERPVDAIEVRGGQQSTVIDVTAGTVTSVNGHTGAVTITGSDVGAPDWINAIQRGAAGDGVTDDTAALQAAIDACPPGGTVYFPRGVYKTTATLDLKSGVTLLGSHSNLMVGPGMGDGDYPCYIQAAGPFTGTSVIQIIGDADGTHPAISGEQRISNLMIDGSQLAGTSVDGLYARGNVQNVVLDDFCVRQMPNNGIVTAANAGGQWPFSWRMRHVMADGCHAHGFLFSLMTDLTAIDCQAIGSWANGWVLTNLPNSQLTNCRAEWCGNHGYLINGDWGNGAGSGGAVFTGCSTDRNGWDGIHVSAAGTAPLQFNGLMLRRDGRNGGTGGGGYAGLAVAASGMPVIASNVTCFPGVDDTGTSTSSPQYGVSVTGSSTLLQLDDASLHAATRGLNSDNTSTVMLGQNVAYATGPTSAPVRSVQPRTPDWINVALYGARGDGVTDDTAAIQAALNACPAGGVVYMPAKVFRTSAPIKVPPYVTLRGGHGGGEAQSLSAPTPACIKPLATFTGNAVIAVLDQQLGGYATITSEVKIEGVTVDGSAVPAGTPVDGILATGQVQHLQIRDVQIRQVTGKGINTAFNTGAPPGPQAPFCLHVERVSVLWAASHGVVLNNSTDSAFYDVYVLGCSGFGWYISGADNSMWVACRAEWSSLDGFNLAGGNGVQAFIGCATDRNGQNGISVPASTDTGTILLSGCHLKRDGKASTTAGYAGLKVASSSRKVVADNLITTTGRDDDSTGNLTPQYGVSAANSAYVTVASGVLAGVAAGWNDGGGNTTLLRGPLVTGTGITSWTWPGTASTTAAAATSTILQALVAGDTQPRWTVDGQGRMKYGPGGTTAPDTGGWYRNNVGVLQSDSFVVFNGGVQSNGSFTAFQASAKALVAGTAGGGVAIKEGANARMGTATLVTGTVTVSNTSVTATTRIIVTRQGSGGTLGHLSTTRTAGTSFTIASSSATETSTVAWLLVEPA
ncbi:glycosyl hydrolase family 28-related protein [Streptomyces mirabilis]|uniref:glycosyl hydrolase family 28-related protein n=1 Tax=Streptomyces mirabilis TaxID=68239 RepID=UPI003676B916